MLKALYFMEIWKPIAGFDGCYEVSNLGHVKSIGRLCKRKLFGGFMKVKERIMKPHLNKFGYQQIYLSRGGVRKRYSVHRLVALSYIPNPNGKPNVNHIDGNPKNNKVENLEWCTQSENSLHSIHVLGNKHGVGNKNQDKKIPIICFDDEGNIINQYDSTVSASKDLGIHRNAITNNISGVSKYCNYKNKKVTFKKQTKCQTA